MTEIPTKILLISFIVLFILTAYIYIKAGKWMKLIIYLLLLMLVVVILNYYFGFPDYIIYMGVQTNETVYIILGYICMIGGMIANYYYKQADKKRFKTEIVQFVRPFFISPLVFIPVLEILPDSGFQRGIISKEAIIFFALSFQNGFFWKDVLKKDDKK